MSALLLMTGFIVGCIATTVVIGVCATDDRGALEAEIERIRFERDVYEQRLHRPTTDADRAALFQDGWRACEVARGLVVS